MRFAIILIISMFSSSSPDKFYAYSQNEVSIELEVAQDDSFDISIAYRISTSYKEETFPIEVEMVSPAGEVLREYIALPSSENYNGVTGFQRSGHYYDIEWIYRKNAKPSLCGKWVIKLKNNNINEEIGLGINYERKR